MRGGGTGFLRQATPGRHLVLAMLFFASVINYGDRAVIGITAAAIVPALKLSMIQLGYLISASSLFYLILQVPGGLVADRVGARWVNCGALFCLSIATVTQGLSSFAVGTTAFLIILIARFLSGACSAPIVPANFRTAAIWFPADRRGLAMAILNSAQYAALIAFAPLATWITHRFSWPYAFYALGVIGILIAVLFPVFVRSRPEHPLIGPDEVAVIEHGSGLIQSAGANSQHWPSLELLRRIAFRRQLLGLYLFQYCIGVLASFFTGWAPMYFVKRAGMSMIQTGMSMATLGISALIGGIVGGLLSDTLLRRGHSLTFARGMPVFLGLSAGIVIVIGNYTKQPAYLLGALSIAFFGKGLAALGWTMVSDIAPRNLIGTTGGIFNLISICAGAFTPVIFGHLVELRNSFDWVILFVASHSLLGMAAFAAIIRRIERIDA